MKTAAIATALAGTAALAASIPRDATTDIDPVVLNFALTLEHLEDNFYRGALDKFSEADFAAAGAPPAFYKALQYIASDEATHVQELTSALSAANVTPVKECTYKFPYTDAKSFLGLSTILEGVGTSAYLGGAPLITSKAYLTAAGSILVSEALHTSLLRSTTGLIPNANPNGTPLDPTSVYSLAAPFFVSCPSDSPALPFKPFPAVTGPSSALNQGDKAALKTEATIPEGSYLTFVSGLAVVSVKGDASNGTLTAAVPSQAAGQTYVLITKGDANGTLNDADVVAGPAIIEVNPAAVKGSTGNATASSPSGSKPTQPVTNGASKMATSGLALAGVIAASLLL